MPSTFATRSDVAVIQLEVGGAFVRVVRDHYSNRIRCDHPKVSTDGRLLGEGLEALARRSGFPRLMCLAPSPVGEGLTARGFALVGEMPEFYGEGVHCQVLWQDLRGDGPAWVGPRPELGSVETRAGLSATSQASLEDCEGLAALMRAVFEQYPVAADDPAYHRALLQTGHPYRVVRGSSRQEVVACATAELITEWRAAELSNCATSPEHRGRGHMQSLLEDLCEDLRALNYSTAFAFVRANNSVANRIFHRVGLTWRGRLRQSCRIGNGLEDMNLWSRSLQA